MDEGHENYRFEAEESKSLNGGKLALPFCLHIHVDQFSRKEGLLYNETPFVCYFFCKQ
jgi:hypothetical protein